MFTPKKTISVHFKLNMLIFFKTRIFLLSTFPFFQNTCILDLSVFSWIVCVWTYNFVTVIYFRDCFVVFSNAFLFYFRGLLSYKEKVSKYWPDFGQNGKENVTLEQLISNQVSNLFEI